MKKEALLVLATASICFGAQAAPPAEKLSPSEVLPPQDRQEAFRTLDTDGNGWISRTEAAAHPVVAANFDKVDHDRDGRLSRDEFDELALNRSDQPGRFRTPERG